MRLVAALFGRLTPPSGCCPEQGEGSARRGQYLALPLLLPPPLRAALLDLLKP